MNLIKQTLNPIRCFLLLCFGFFVNQTNAQNVNTDDTLNTQELASVSVIGTRGKPRTDVNRPVPVDIISAKDLQSTGQVDLGQSLQYSSPSFSSTKNGINGTANYVDPATLRGLGPDQTLVLIDGKRRHQYSALNLNVTLGKGTLATDLNAIPSLAIERLEILRDGAAAQYGSDAIAGVINLGLNKSVGKLTARTQVGTHKEGDGQSYNASLNYGIKLGKDKSYANFTLNYLFAGLTDRSDNYIGTFYSSTAAIEAEARATSTKWLTGKDYKVSKYGSNQTEAFQGVINVGFPLNDNFMAYGFGTYSLKKIKAFGFYRNLTTAANANKSIYPDGYTPDLPGETVDYSAMGGIKGNIAGWALDLSSVYGFNSLELWANNTTNASMGATSPKDFYVGKYKFGQSTTDFGVNKNFKGVLGTKDLSIAAGVQYRMDNYQLIAGDEASYTVGSFAASDNKTPGSNGRPGNNKADELNESRNNFGAYLDLENDITDKLLVSVAGRFENYSDFGSNFTSKFSARYKIIDALAIRGSVNKGFRAPNLQQTFNSVTTSTVQNGTISQTKGLRSDNATLLNLGVEKLKAENSWNYNVGLTLNINNTFLLTADAYQIDITDRVAVSEDLTVSSIIALKNNFTGLDKISFFTNLLDTKTQGLDIVATYKVAIDKNQKFTAILASSFNKTEITGVKATPDALQAGTTTAVKIIDTVSRSLVETSQPRIKVVASLVYDFYAFTLAIRRTYFGEVTAWEKIASTGNHRSQTFAGKNLLDLSLSFRPCKYIDLTLGANNVTDQYPDKVYNNYSSYFNGQTPYSRNASQFGFNGAYYYLNATIRI